SGAPINNIAFTDTLPAGLAVSTPSTVTVTGCSFADLIAASGSSLITVNQLIVPGTTTCLVNVVLIGTSAGVKNNTTSTIAFGAGSTMPGVSASITVVAPPTLAKAFGVGTVTQGSGTSLTFSLANPNTTIALTGVGFTDTLPSGVVVATPNALTSTCAGG